MSDHGTMFGITIHLAAPAPPLRRLFVFLQPLLTVHIIVGFLAMGWTSLDAQYVVPSWQRDFTLTPESVGPLRIGMTADEVIALYGPRATAVDLRLEGTASPALEIRLASPSAKIPSLTAEIYTNVQNRIGRVRVFDPRFKTTDGLGVGSTLKQVRAHHSVQVGYGEGDVYGVVAELPMSFDFGGWPTARLPDSAVVKSVLVLGTAKSFK